MNIKRLLAENNIDFRDIMEHGDMLYSLHCRYCGEASIGAQLLVINERLGSGICATCGASKSMDELIADYGWKVPQELLWENHAASVKDFQKLNVLGIGQIKSMQFTDQKWIIEGLIPAEAITMLSGDPENGKSWLTLEAARCVATGEPFLGKFKTTQGTALVVDEEDHLRFVKERIDALNITSEMPVCYLSQEGVKLDNDKWFEALKKEMEYGYKLIVFDSLIRIHSGNENDSRDISRVFDRLRELAKLGCAVLITHHNRKSSGEGSQKYSDKVRGSSDIFAALDSHLSVEMHDDSITMRQNKMRMAAKLKPFEIAISRDKGGCPVAFTYSGEVAEKTLKKDEVKSIILEALKVGPLERPDLNVKVRTAMPVGYNAIGDALGELVDDKLVDAVAGTKNKKMYSLKAGGLELNESN